MKAYGREVVQTSPGWTYTCECSAVLGGTAEDELDIRNGIYQHRKRPVHAQALAAREPVLAS